MYSYQYYDYFIRFNIIIINQAKANFIIMFFNLYINNIIQISKLIN